MDKNVLHLIKKLAILTLPIWIVIIIYMALDPFKVILDYDSYFEQGVSHVSMNMDMVSTENFANRNPQEHYNAFIMGNSRSQYWRVDDWKKHIGKEASCYHYYGNGESLYALSRHLDFIHRNGNAIDYCLLIVDAELLSQTRPRTDHLAILPPRTEGLSTFLDYHVTNFTAFLYHTFFPTYIDFILHRKQLQPYMIEKKIFEPPVKYDARQNEVRDYIFDEEIANGTYYTSERVTHFEGKQYPDSTSPAVISEEGIKCLHHIAEIFKRHRTQYKIVVSPLYNQIAISEKDKCILKAMLGEQNMYDFSGKNAITSDFHHYYEESHYLPSIASQLMDSIYKTTVSNQPQP